MIIDFKFWEVTKGPLATGVPTTDASAVNDRENPIEIAYLVTLTNLGYTSHAFSIP